MPVADRVERIEKLEKSGDKDDRHDRERMKAVELAVGQIEKQFGKGSIMRLGQKGAIQPIDFISTGAISIDYALGVGGVPRGRVVEIYGPESSGKTTLALRSSPRRRSWAGWPRSSMPRIRSRGLAQKPGVEIPTIARSWPTTASRRLK